MEFVADSSRGLAFGTPAGSSDKKSS
jgi:hypothetical protein